MLTHARDMAIIITAIFFIAMTLKNWNDKMKKLLIINVILAIIIGVLVAKTIPPLVAGAVGYFDKEQECE